MKPFKQSAFVALAWTALVLPTQAITRTWTNTLSGDWFTAVNWSPNGVPATADNVLITNNGTYTVAVLTNAAAVGTLTLGGSSGTQTLLNGYSSPFSTTNLVTVRNNGLLIVTNGGFTGGLFIESGGQLQFNAGAGLQLYNSAITNQGTVTWSSGYLAVGGNNSQATIVSNGGLWQITGNDLLSYGGGSRPLFINGGTLRKSTGAGTSQISGMDLVNLPSGLVDVLSGTLWLLPYQTNFLGGTFSATSPGAITFSGGSWTDTGGVSSGNGTIQFTGGNFYLRTNLLAGLKLAGGDIYINTSTFQQSGAITNLSLDGAQLHGTNRIAGTLTFNAGSLVDQLTVLPSGQLILATTGSKLLYTLNLINQGTVNWTRGGLAVGGTPPTVVSNGGLWQMSSDDALSYGGGNTPWFTNYATIRKTAGTSSSSLAGFSFLNQPGGVIEADAGAIQFPANYTNAAGELRLNGGAFLAGGGFTFNGGTLDGSGSVGQSSLLGGTLSPGLGGPGIIGFSQGLTLGSNATLVIDGTGTVPGSQYDQLSVTGAVALGHCTLQVTSLPSVPPGTTFVIINNDGVDAVSDIFNGLPENSVLSVGAQPFRIHYAGGSGNDVTLVRDSGVAGPLLSAGGGSYTNGALRLTGLGGVSLALTIQATTNFVQWTSLGAATSDLSGHFSFTDTNAARFPYRFYRTTN